MVTNDLCIAICFVVFLFGIACGIVIGIKAEDRQRRKEDEAVEIQFDFTAFDKFSWSGDDEN